MLYVDGYRLILIVYYSDLGDLKLVKILYFFFSYRVFGDIS